MSDVVIGVSAAIEPAGGLTNVWVGCCGKIPARGDFIRLGLPRDFLDCWDAWFAAVLAASRGILGEGWEAAWLEAPVWQFALAPGVCGARAAVGVWMPSVDRVGRYFPLTIVAIADDATAGDLIYSHRGFLDAAIEAGLAALSLDLSPDELMVRILAAAVRQPQAAISASSLQQAQALWWTSGAPRVAAGEIRTAGLPEAETFRAMLDGGQRR
jgi:type VI secretion system protein ImpM